MLHQHQFREDPDATQAIEDAIEFALIPQLDAARAKARLPHLTPAQRDAASLEVREAKALIALKADRAGLDLDSFIDHVREELRLRGGGARRRAQADARSSDAEYRRLSAAVETAAAAEAETAAARRKAHDAFMAAKQQHTQALTNLQRYAIDRSGR